jgi:protease-4
MGQFLKQTFASLIGTLVGLFLFVALGASGLVLLLFTVVSRDDSATVQNKSVLVFDLSTQIDDTKSPATLAKVFAGEETNIMTLRQVLDSINQATQDSRIVGIFLDGRRQTGSINGYATLKEVRAALERFRAAGKKIIAYQIESREQNYYLASVADTIVFNPAGLMEMNGLGVQPLFLKGALEKYGIGVQVVRVGKYKSAIEPFTRQNLSPESREQTQALLTNLWGDFLTTVGKSRQLSPSKLQAIADRQGIFNPEEARTSGLIDRVAYLDQVIADLTTLTGKDGKGDRSFRQISLETYADTALKKARNPSSRNKIAIIYAEGTIVNGQGNRGEVGGDRFAKALRKLRQDEEVKAVVVRINSPGGSATASDIILRELQLIRAQKPVIVSMGDVAASGGYWIATGAEEIFADANTITGSIGVFGLLPNIKKIASDNGINWDVVKTGRFADLNTITRPKTEQELALYQKYVNQTYDRFLDTVAESRQLPKEKVAQIAQGRVWSGENARKIGLVDRLGGLEAAIRYAAEKAKLGSDWTIQEYPEKQSLVTEILGKFTDSDVMAAVQQQTPLTTELLKFKEELTILQTLNDPKGIYARLPFNLKID